MSLIINDGQWYCFCKKVPGCCMENLIRDWCLICVIKIESKKTIKCSEKVKKDPLKMLNIYNVLNTELKMIYEYHPYKKNYGRGNMFLVEEIITVVNVSVSGFRT